MLHTVTGARSVGSEVRLRNQTSGVSIGRTSWNVASMFINIFKFDQRNAIQLAKLRRCALTCLGDFCFRSFLSVISVTYRISYN
ncbi:hypothetical protein AM363_20435 [Citrobacter freundii]|uniref:Uncharacterized protein n=1 Tax=Citrobacter freundii TaxID=546 RepID=A0AA44NNP9_CITFR|nr:hypothetical protein CES93_07545 [Citrobacter freundii]AUZ70474.1 hypothetical protein C2U41_14515 [Citrobacter freundii complex sp. CFNIH4]POU13052.1 hypothetical protein C3368_08735 [Citrobacter freundii complex sp. CFNIH7]POU16652.1 hypothetical protein C3381_07585 [Citrobacter freundii complex sp. CFNIH6]POU21572.1 hypothetical protein C3391_11370 [Citrobacter freundii complex sp. CFNIH8]POU45621.1 hypothetical protein C3375_10690 [Citrobacter freundii complex sp. CFNIH12]POV67109.1 hy